MATAVAGDAHARVRYETSSRAWMGYLDYVQNQIITSGAHRVLELGGGANPFLPLEFLERHGIEYTVLDISPVELAKAPGGYKKICCDIGSEQMDFAGLAGEYDLIFSKMLAEHVKNGPQLHRNVFKLLAAGGKGVHYFPTLYAPPFIVNRLFPEKFNDRLLHWAEPGREKDGKKGKFPAYYTWCRGPTRRQLARLRGVGFDVEEYIGFFGHNVYYRRIPVLRTVHRKLCRWLVRHPVPALTSSAYVVVTKPLNAKDASANDQPAVRRSRGQPVQA